MEVMLLLELRGRDPHSWTPPWVSDCVISLFCYVGPDPMSEEAGEHEGSPECPTVWSALDLMGSSGSDLSHLFFFFANAE